MRRQNSALQLTALFFFVSTPAILITSTAYSRQSTTPVIINEVVTDPQQDWSDNAGGNGIAFDNVPGNGSITDTDEWVELFNAGTQAIDLTNWTMDFINGTTSTLSFSGPGTTELRFSAGGSVTNFQPGEYLVIGNPPGAINNDVYITLKNNTGALVDDVEIGDDFEGDGSGDGAPDGGTSDGNATGVDDEAVARFPNAADTENDVDDFAKQAATIGASNGEPPTLPAVVVINEIVTDPQQDWSDNAGGNGIAFDDVPGNGSITDTDEWIELFNAGTQAVNLAAGSGWTMDFINGTTSTLNFSSPGTTELRFSAGGSVTNFQPGEYLVIGNPPGAINNDVYIVLKDAVGAIVDDVEIGDDFEGDGSGDGAPDGGTSDGNATGVDDEAVARVPNAVDTGNDVSDFTQQAATIGASNDVTPTPPDIAVDPASHDYGDVIVGQFGSKIFVVSNAGISTLKAASSTPASNLEVTALTLVGANADQFSIDDGQAPFTLAPNESRNVTVSFRPTSAGVKSAALQFASNDPDENPLDVPLTGNGTAPAPFCDLSVVPATYHFGKIEQGLFADKIFTLSNAANATDNCAGSAALSGDGEFAIISGKNFSIPPGGTHQLTVRFDCRDKETGPRSATLQLTSNDPDAINVPLTGECVSPTPCRADFIASGRFGISPFTVEFTNLSTGDINSYLWDFGDGTTSTERNPKHTYKAECVDPQFDVRLTVNGRCGQDLIIKTSHIIVHPPSECVFFGCPTGGPPPLRVGFVNQLLDYATGYLWNFGDGSTSTEALPVHVYNQPGVYDVSLTIHTALGSATVTLNDYVNVQRHFVAPAPLLSLNGPEFAIKSTGGEDVCGWNLWSNGFIAHDVTISGKSRWFALEAVAAGSFAGGAWPQMQLLIDEVLIDEQTIAHSSARSYHFLARLSAGTHRLKLAFPNDFDDPVTKEARQLFVARLLMFDSGAPLAVPGKLNAAAMAIKTHGDSLGNGAWNLFSNGFLGHGLAVADSGNYGLNVKASAHVAGGEGPKLAVSIDGAALDTVEVSAGGPQNLSFPLKLAKGNHFLQLAFINNDILHPASTEDRNLILHEFAVTGGAPPIAPQVVINEIVTDPQQDWSDNAGGNGVSFDRTPGNGSITDTDEWLELFNTGSQAVDLTEGAGWSIEFINGSTSLLNFQNPGTSVLRFSHGGSATNFKAGEYLIIGNPPGAINNDVYIILKDATGNLVDDVEIGSDFEGDGSGDGAPDGGSSDGNATGINNEAVARAPNGVDTENDVADFAQQMATIGVSNDSTGTPPTHVKEAASSRPTGFVLHENYPNPFNPTTKIKFDVPEASRVVLTIHNLTGQEVARLLDDELAAGEYAREWEAAQQVTGIYFARFVAVGKNSGKQVTLVKKMLLAK